MWAKAINLLDVPWFGETGVIHAPVAPGRISRLQLARTHRSSGANRVLPDESRSRRGEAVCERHAAAGHANARSACRLVFHRVRTARCNAISFAKLSRRQEGPTARGQELGDFGFAVDRALASHLLWMSGQHRPDRGIGEEGRETSGRDTGPAARERVWAIVPSRGALRLASEN